VDLDAIAFQRLLIRAQAHTVECVAHGARMEQHRGGRGSRGVIVPAARKSGSRPGRGHSRKRCIKLPIIRQIDDDKGEAGRRGCLTVLGNIPVGQTCRSARVLQDLAGLETRRRRGRPPHEPSYAKLTQAPQFG